tara:strand:+ start:624 stop:1559 length:936 start_codon:yes stop_codon:yes gene_type:complete
MNDDLVLRARLVELGHEDADFLEKRVLPRLGGRPKSEGGKGAARLPFIGQAIDRARTGTPKKYQKQEMDAAKIKNQEAARTDQRMNMAARGIPTQALGPDKSGLDKENEKSAVRDTEKLMDSQGLNQQQQQPLMDNLEQVPPAPDLNAMGGQGQENQPQQNQPQQPQQNQPQPQPQPQQPQGGNMAVDPSVQTMAQQYGAAQDMQTLDRGKGGPKQSYFGNRSGLGMAADFLTGGLTSQFGSTGGIARRRANKKSEQQTQDYQAAQSRMNQRAMGMSPVMTSFDNQLSAYDDIISLRKGVQERNTTRNLRR